VATPSENVSGPSASPFEFNSQRANSLTEGFGPTLRRFGGRAGKDQAEFLTALAAGNVTAADVALKNVYHWACAEYGRPRILISAGRAAKHRSAGSRALGGPIV